MQIKPKFQINFFKKKLEMSLTMKPVIAFQSKKIAVEKGEQDLYLLALINISSLTDCCSTG